MQSVVEVVCVGGSGSNKTFNSVYSDPGVCKMVIVQDDDKFPSPRLCLLRRWPNFDGGFGFKLYEDLISSTGALKVEEVVRHSPAEAGGLRKNDVIIEINGDNIEFKSFFRLVEVLKEACSRNKMELLVLAEQDAEWYRVRNITVNSHFPNIEYCETPYYGHILKPIDSIQAGPNQTKTGPSQIEFHSSSGKLYRTTLVIDKDKDTNKDFIYRRIEELPETSNADEEVGTTAGSTIAPLRPDGTYRHPSSDPNSSVRVYYRRMNPTPVRQSDDQLADSGHCTLADRRSTPLNTTTSPYSTLGKDNGERSVDLLHDKWGDLMDKYLDTKFKSADTGLGDSQATNAFTDSQQQPDRDTNTLKKSHIIKLNDPNMSSTMKRSRTQSPNDPSTFSYLYSGRDDYQTASPYQRGSPYTQSHNRFTSPQPNVQSPTRVNRPQPQQSKLNTNQDTSKGHQLPLNKATLRPGETPSYVSTFESTYVKHSINVIYDNSQDANNVTSTSDVKHKQQQPYKPTEIKPTYSTSIPTVSAQKQQKIEQAERERELAEREERERLERERIQREKEEAERRERERREREERERKEREERERLERERAERLERERLERLERERIQREKEEAERRERERKEREERERLERLERERIQREKEEAERRERERLERLERERIQREKEEAERRERERIQREKEEAERRERERIQREKEEAERRERERIQREKEEAERRERERIQREKEEAERRERERREKEEAERRERERLQREREERERLERERLQREREERERLEHLERERLDRLEWERIQREREDRLEIVNVDRPPTSRPAPSAVKDALAALTTIVVNSNSTEKLNDATEIPIIKSEIVYKQQPIPLVNESSTTTKITETYEIHRFNREEIVENPSSSKLSYVDQSGSSQDHDIETEDDRARREHAEREFVRQQEVMGYLVEAMDNLKVDDKLRTYSLYKSQHFFGFGIAFHTESIPATLPKHKLVYPLVEIESNSPAEEAGMRNGQRVVAVNGEFVNRDFRTLEEVVQAIEDSYYNRNFTDITVIDPELWTDCMEDPNYAAQLAKHRVVTPPPIIPEPVISKYDKSAPRFCHLVRSSRSDQYGFDFKTLKTEGRHIANNVRPGLPADRAGLRDGDFILEVNGEPLENMEHDAVVSKISNNPTQVDLLVVGDINAYLGNRKATDINQTRQLPLTHDEVNIDLRLPNVVYHRVNLVPGFKGLGISLTPNGVISAIEPNSPSDRAGLRIGDRIVEVNGVDVRDKSNREIAKIIKENENDLVIGVLTNPDQPHPMPTPSPPVHDTSGSSNLKSIVAEMIKPTQQQPVVDYPLPAQPLPTQPTVSEQMPNIKGIIADVIKMQAPDTVNLDKSTPTRYSRNLSIEPTDEIPGSRICQLIRNEDYDGFGFSMRANDKGPHQVSSVEPNSPAERGGLRTDDLILKVNDINVVGERYSKTVAQIKNESERGILKLEVIDPYQCPPSIKNTLLAPSAYSTMSKGVAGSRPISDSTQNLRNITREAIDTDVSTRSRAVSVDTGSERMRPPRPLSANDIDINQNSTVRSYGSAMTGLSETPGGANLMNQSSRSMGTLPSKYDKQKFKRCTVNLTPESDNFGFTLNSRIKPKYMIYDVAFNSPAYMANLRTNDVIVEIDRNNIRRMKFDKVKEMLNRSKQNRRVEVLAISKEGYLYYKNKKKRFSSTKLVTTENTEIYPNANISSNYGGGNFGTFKSQSPTMSIGDRVQQEPTATITSTTSNRLISASSTRLDQPTTYPTAISATVHQTRPQIALEPDNVEVVYIELNRRNPDSPLGLSLANQANKTLSKSSGVSFKDDPLLLPVITKVDPNSAAEDAGLRAGDSVLEINGKRTNGLNNGEIANLIKSAGNSIQFCVSRKRTADELIRADAARITQQTIKDAQLRVNEYDTRELVDATPIAPSSSQRLSRRDQGSPSLNSQRSSPRVVHEEIRMSSSKLHDSSFSQQSQPQPQPSQASPSPRLRNQSEPAPAGVMQQLPLQTSTDLNKSVTSDTFQSSPISRRSSSSYTLPPDAPIPRLCRVRAYENQLGFTIAGSRSNRGVFKISDITPNSPAAHSGLQNDDYIIEISGMNVESKDYSQVVDYIKAKKEEDDLQLLVADRATLLWYKSKRIPISSQIVPKMQYIETLLKDEIDREKENYEYNKTLKIPLQNGQAANLKRKIHLAQPSDNTTN